MQKVIFTEWYTPIAVIVQQLIDDQAQSILCVDSRRAYIHLAQKQDNQIQIFGNILQTFERTPERICQLLAVLAKLNSGFIFLVEHEGITITTSPGVTARELLKSYQEAYKAKER